MKYQNWKPLWKDPLISANKAEELEQRFADLIKQQIWQPGEVIPPQQVIARKLHLSKGTVEKAFRHLLKMNVIFTRRGQLSHISGSYTLSKTELYMLSHLGADHVNRFPNQQSEEITYIQLGNSYPPLYDLNIDTYIQGFNSTLRSVKKDAMGLEACRQHTDAALKMILESREILVADNEYTMVPKGRALDMVARLLFAKGGLLIMDVANDLCVARSFITAGAHVKYTGTSNGVMDMDRLEKLCLTEIPVAVFVRSAASYLEGRSLPEESRNRLLELAATHQFELICMHEHTEMWLKVPRKPLLLRSGNTGIIYVSPLSNLNAMTDDLALVVAHSAFIDVLRREVYSSIANRDYFTELAILLLVAKGKLREDTARLLKIYKTRLVYIYRYFKTFLGAEATIKASDAGLTIWINLLTPLSAHRVMDLLKGRDLFDELKNMHLDRQRPVQALRISYADKGAEVWKTLFEGLAIIIRQEKKARHERVSLQQ